MDRLQSLTIVLPTKLPTWNALLAMHHYQRAKVRCLIHRLVYESIHIALGSSMLMVSPLNTQSTDLSWVESSQTTQRKKFAKSYTRRRKSKTRVKKKRKLPLSECNDKANQNQEKPSREDKADGADEATETLHCLCDYQRR